MWDLAHVYPLNRRMHQILAILGVSGQVVLMPEPKKLQPGSLSTGVPPLSRVWLVRFCGRTRTNLCLLQSVLLLFAFAWFSCCFFTLSLLFSYICRDAVRRRSRAGQVGGLGWARQRGKGRLHVSAEGAGLLRVDVLVEEGRVLRADQISAQPDHVQHNRFLGTTAVSHTCGALHRVASHCVAQRA